VSPCGLDWQVSQIIAVQLQEIKGVEHRDRAGTSTVQRASNFPPPWKAEKTQARRERPGHGLRRARTRPRNCSCVSRGGTMRFLARARARGRVGEDVAILTPRCHPTLRNRGNAAC
jgi:hypothetical protein